MLDHHLKPHLIETLANTPAAAILTVPAGEFQRHIGRYLDIALTQPVAVTRNRQVLTLDDFTDADIAALEATRAPESTKAFDHELNQ